VADVIGWIHHQLHASGKELLFAKHLRNKALACEAIVQVAARNASIAGAVPIPGADLIEKLKRYDWELEKRNKIAAAYQEGFGSLGSKCVTPKLRANRGSVWAQYTVPVQARHGYAAKLNEHVLRALGPYPSPPPQYAGCAPP